MHPLSITLGDDHIANAINIFNRPRFSTPNFIIMLHNAQAVDPQVLHLESSAPRQTRTAISQLPLGSPGGEGIRPTEQWLKAVFLTFLPSAAHL